MQKALGELEDDKLIYTERTNGKYVTSDNKVILKVKDEIARKEGNEYLKSMKKIGIDKDAAIKYLESLGGKK